MHLVIRGVLEKVQGGNTLQSKLTGQDYIVKGGLQDELF